MLSQASGLDVLFLSVGPSNLDQLKTINRVIFPIKYQERFYQDCCKSGDVTQLAYHEGKAVGGIACRLELQPDGTAKLYVGTVGVLAPYRGVGLGTRLLQHSLGVAAEDPNITHAYLHVQTNNDKAIQFYQRHGFEVTETLEGYYKRIQPPDAVVLTKKLAVHNGG